MTSLGQFTTTWPAGVRDVAALMTFGPVRAVGPHPPTAVYVVRHAGSADSIWIDLGYPQLDYTALWRMVYPTTPVPAGSRAAPLISREDAQHQGFRFVRLGLVGLGGAHNAAGEYLLTSVSHWATDSSY